MLSNPIFVQKQVTVNDSLKFDDNLQIHQNVEGSNFGKYNSRWNLKWRGCQYFDGCWWAIDKYYRSITIDSKDLKMGLSYVARNIFKAIRYFWFYFCKAYQ